MWDEISVMLNSSGCGPQKKSKDWAKTWRDWKSNVLKKVAAHKAYTTGTGGRPPQVFKSTQVEDSLLEFLTPDAAGLSGIPEGGFGDEFPLAVSSSSIIEIDKHSQRESIDNDDDDPMEKIDYEDSSMKENTASEHHPSGRKATRKSVIHLLEEKTLSSDEYKKKCWKLSRKKCYCIKTNLLKNKNIVKQY